MWPTKLEAHNRENLMDAKAVIEKLGLEPLPEEGGFYRETYRDSGKIPASALMMHEGERSYSTCIYYLITPEEFSGLHAVKSTEVFHFYLGDPVEMLQISEDGSVQKTILGHDIFDQQSPQIVVEPGIWQGTKLVPGGKWALLGCTVAPGFEFSDFSEGTYENLSKKFPKWSALIKEYTHR